MAKKISSKRTKVIEGSWSESSPAEQIASSLDPLTEILLRVPVKSLLRFKSVSKHWLSLISDSLFASNYTGQNHPNSNFTVSGLYVCSSSLFYTDSVHSIWLLHNKTSPVPPLAFLDATLGKRFSSTQIIDSCKGLLLCRCVKGYKNRYIVCNPTTQKYSILPPQPQVPPVPSSSSSCDYVFRVCLAFDPSKSRHYKVVVVVVLDNNNYDDDYQIDIYSSETSSWKQISVTAQGDLLEPSLGGFFWNGAIHWFNELHVRFEVDSEKLITMPNPNIFNRKQIRYFGECGGHLILILQIRLRFGDAGFKVLDMSRDYCGWIDKYRVDLTVPLLSTRGEVSEIPMLPSVTKGLKEEDYSLVLAISGRVISYNLKFNTVEWLHKLWRGYFDELSRFYCYSTSYQYIETLSPV